MKDVEKAIEFFVSLAPEMGDVIKGIMNIRGIGIIANISNIDALPEIKRIFDENGINYINAVSGLPEFSMFTNKVEELTAEKLEVLGAQYGYKDKQTMGR